MLCYSGLLDTTSTINWVIRGSVCPFPRNRVDASLREAVIPPYNFESEIFRSRDRTPNTLTPVNKKNHPPNSSPHATMPQFSLDDFDKHIASLQSQLRSLNSALEATDHNSPEWLATDLISLRNKSGRLQDDMQQFRERLESEGLGVRKESNKRLSIEGASDKIPPPRKSLESASAKSFHDLESHRRLSSAATTTAVNTAMNPLSSPPPQAQPSISDYTPQHMDVSEEVHRRLQESRLRRLMGSPSTSQKRKYNVFESTKMGVELEGGNAGDEEEEEGGETERSPFKRIKASGSFGGMVSASIDSVLKRKDGDGGAGGGKNKKRRFAR
ncbi:unnamed protein product [Periconia digitata]|uniref:Uncharacterized protein n=1 Tax=Periconia digitata TaxID=1303443 RepID=A0A9W4XID7_9PLEO|nr:unnamed protein product [Periconia digitata]